MIIEVEDSGDYLPTKETIEKRFENTERFIQKLYKSGFKLASAGRNVMHYTSY